MKKYWVNIGRKQSPYDNSNTSSWKLAKVIGHREESRQPQMLSMAEQVGEVCYNETKFLLELIDTPGTVVEAYESEIYEIEEVIKGVKK